MFKRGQFVRLINGRARLHVDACNGYRLTGTYTNGVQITRAVEQFTYHKCEEQHMTNPFHVGQRICFKIGHKPMRVTRINGKYIDALYLDNRNKRIYNRCWLDFKSLPEEQPEPAPTRGAA